MLSVPHMIVVFIIVLVVFGPNKLPELARGLGKLMAEFRKASADFKGAFEQEIREMERQTMLAERKKAAEAAAASAAAAPEQPATLATAAGTDTQPTESADTRATEALMATPVAEAIARGQVEDAPSVSLDTASVSSQDENTIGNGNASAGSQNEAAANSMVTHDPAHDTQQPA
jgi:TatA/E family protein of Tat protein translocase